MKRVSIQRKQMGRTTENGKELEGHGVQVYQRWGGVILYFIFYSPFPLNIAFCTFHHQIAFSQLSYFLSSMFSLCLAAHKII